jgi:hypothetical protein
MNLTRILTFALCLMCSYANAAAPGTHVYSAQLWMEMHGPLEQKDREAFVAGTLFPDIRYTGTISRDDTHESDVTAKKIRNTSNPFTAGKRLHAFVDVKRENFVERKKIYSHLSDIPKKTRVLFLKILEDEILWDQTDCEFSKQAMQEVYPEEIKAGVEHSVVQEWHQTMINYFNQRPSVFLMNLAAENKGFLKADAKTVEEWSRILPEYAADPFFIDYVESMVKELQKHYKK